MLRGGWSWGKWSPDGSGNENIGYRDFTAPCGQRSGCLSPEMSVYSSKAKLPCGRLCVLVCLGEEVYCCNLVHLAKVTPLS